MPGFNLKEVTNENVFVNELISSKIISKIISKINSEPTSVANASLNETNQLNQSEFTINKEELTGQIRGKNPDKEKNPDKIKIDTELDAIFGSIVESPPLKDIIVGKYPETSKVVGGIYYAINHENEKQQGGGPENTPNPNNQIVSTPYQYAENKKLWISIFFFVISAVMIFETFSTHYEIIIKFANAISEIIMNFENTSIVQSLIQISKGSAFQTLIHNEKQAIMSQMNQTLGQIAGTPVTTTIDAIFSLFTGTESITALHARQTLDAVLQMRLSNVAYVANKVQFTIKYAIPACVTSICGIFKYGSQHLNITNEGITNEGVNNRLTNLVTQLAPTPSNGGFRKRTIKHKRSKKSNMASKSHKKKSKAMKSKAMKSKKRTSHKSKRSKTLKRGRKH